MIIRRKIYWHAAVIANVAGDYDPEAPISDQKAFSTLVRGDDETNAWLASSASEFIYGVKNCVKIPVSLNVQDDSVLDVDTNGNPMGLRADNPVVSPGEIRFVLPPSALEVLLGPPVEVSSVADFNAINRTPIRYRLFAVYKSGAGVSCSDSPAPDSYFSSENIPDDVVPSNDGVSRAQMEEAMGPVADLDSQGNESGFYVKMKRHEPIDVIGCCDIVAGGVLGSSSSSSYVPDFGECPETPVPIYISTSSEYRIWMVRQAVHKKFHENPGVAELVYADMSDAIDINTGNIDPSSVAWNHAGFINFEDVHPKIYNSLANTVSFNNESGSRNRSRIITSDMFDVSKDMPVYIQHIAWDNRGFLWALCSGDFKMLPSDAESGNFVTTEGIYRLIPGGWHYVSSSVYSWGGGNHGSNVSASLVEPFVGNISKVVAGYAQTNSTYHTSFSVILDAEGRLHGRFEGISNTGKGISWPDLSADGVIFSDVDAGNSLICAVDTSGKLHAWNTLDGSNAVFDAMNAAVNGANASTFTYLSCAVSMTNNASFIMGLRSDRRTVDVFANASDPTGIVSQINSSLPAGAAIQKIVSGNTFSSVLYTNNSGNGQILVSGTINSTALQGIVGSDLNGFNVVDIDAGYDFLAVCAESISNSSDSPVVRTYTAPVSNGFMIPDNVRISNNDGIAASSVYCGHHAIGTKNSDNNYSFISSDDRAFSSVNSGAISSTPEGGLGHAISCGIHSRDGVSGVRKFAVMAASNRKDINNGSVSIWVKYFPDNSTPSNIDAPSHGGWIFVQKIFASDFSAIVGSTSVAEFGHSVCVTNRGDILVGAPGINRVCVIRKSAAENTIAYTAHAAISPPAGIDSNYRFGDSIKWLDIYSSYGVIFIGAPLKEGATNSNGGALVLSAYSDLGDPDDRIGALFIGDIDPLLSGGNFASSFDVCVPSVSSEDAIIPNRYNIAVSDPSVGRVIHANMYIDSAILFNLVGEHDVIDPPTAGSAEGFASQVKFTHTYRSAGDRQAQLILSWTKDFSISQTTRQGGVWSYEPTVNTINGTFSYSSGSFTEVEIPVDVSDGSGLIIGSKIHSNNGFLVVQASVPSSPNVSHRNSYFIYKYQYAKDAGEDFSQWILVDVFTDDISGDPIYPDVFIFFARGINGHEILIGRPHRFNTFGHEKQGVIHVVPRYEYPSGCGRRTGDIPVEVANSKIKSMAIGRRHQIIAAEDGELYRIPRYIDARLCTAAPVLRGSAVFDSSTKLVVPQRDPILNESPADPNAYHFGSMAAFTVKSDSDIPNHYSIINPVYSELSQTVRVAEMHWKPFKVLDRPSDYENLIFQGSERFKTECSSSGLPELNIIEGQSGYFSPPRIEVNTGVVDADIDNYLGPRSLINTANPYYLAGSDGNSASYISTSIGAVVTNAAINSVSNPSDPLSATSGVESIDLYSYYFKTNCIDVDNIAVYMYLYPRIYAYYGQVRQDVSAGNETNNSYWRFTKKYGMAPLGSVPVGSELVRKARKVIWNCLNSNSAKVHGGLYSFGADILISYLQPSMANKFSSIADYSSDEWHRYLSHPTDTVQNVRTTERQSVFGDINNPIYNANIYSNTNLFPTANWTYTSSSPVAFSSFSNWPIQNEYQLALTEYGAVHRIGLPAQGGSSRDFEQGLRDFLGRGAAILVSNRGTRVAWSEIGWPVGRNLFSYLGGSYNFVNGAELNQPLFDEDIPINNKSIISGISSFPTVTSTAQPAYGIVSAKYHSVSSGDAVNSQNHQVSYLYTLSGVQQSGSNSRSPVDFDEPQFYVPPSLHAVGSGSIYINTGTPANNVLVMLSAASFSRGFASNPGLDENIGVQHLWMQSRPFDGSVFSGSISNMASTMPINPSASDVGNTGYSMDSSQIEFSTMSAGSVRARMVFGDDHKAKTLKNNTSISTWEVGGGISVVAIGARAFCMRNTIDGMNTLSNLISANQISDYMSQVVQMPITTGNRWSLHISAFDNQSAQEKFGRTYKKILQTEDVDMAIALGGGIPFYINGTAHVWYAGYIFKISPSIVANQNVGAVSVEDVTSTVLVDTESSVRIGPGTTLVGDFVQGFVSGYANANWLIISNTRSESDSIYVFKIENDRLVYDSTVEKSNINFFFNPYTNTPFKMSVSIDSTGSIMTVSGHVLFDEADTENASSNQYITGYGNPDQISILQKNGLTWSLYGNISSSQIPNNATSANKRPITTFADSVAIHENGDIKTLLVSGGDDIAYNSNISVTANEEFYSASTQALRARPGKVHKFSLTEIAPVDVAECNDLLPVGNTNFNGSAYANLNFWTCMPMSARNGSQSIVFSSQDNLMYFSTMDDMISMSAKGEGSWELRNSSSVPKIFSTLSAYKYPLPASGVDCVQCATSVMSNISILRPGRISTSSTVGNVAGNVNDGKRVLSYRPSLAPSIIGVDSAPTAASAGLPDVLPSSYGSIEAAPYMHKLNSTARSVQWTASDGYALSYRPSTRVFVKRYPFGSAGASFGSGSPLVTGAQFTPQYAASFATCPPVWDQDAGLWSWAGLRPIRISSSHTHDYLLGDLGPLMQMNWSDIFGMPCFSGRAQDIFVMRESIRDIEYDDLSQDHKNNISTFREDTEELGGADYSNRGGQIVKVTAPVNPDAAGGNVFAAVAVNDFFSSGSGSRFFLRGSGTTMVGATNASVNARDNITVCKSGIAPFARDRSSSALGPVLVLIDDSDSMNSMMNASTSPLPTASSMVKNDFSYIPEDSEWLPGYSPLDNSYPINKVNFYGDASRKYAIDSYSPLYLNTRFGRAMRSLINMFDPLEGDLFAGDQILVACSSSLGSSPSSQVYPSPVEGVSYPLLCICRNDLIVGSMRMSSWKVRSGTDIFSKIAVFNADGSSINGPLFDSVKPINSSQKFSHIVIMCGTVSSVPDGISPSQFSSSIYNKLSAVGATGLLTIGGSVHVIDMDPQSKQDHKRALGAYGTYCIWRGGGG